MTCAPNVMTVWKAAERASDTTKSMHSPPCDRAGVAIQQRCAMSEVQTGRDIDDCHLQQCGLTSSSDQCGLCAVIAGKPEDGI